MKPHELDIGDYSEMVRMFHSESDRGAAVLAGSYIESYLAGFLKAHMINEANTEKLFTQFGPLSSFSQRIEISYAFGLIEKSAYEDLHVIRKIRNYFAHHPKDASFDSSPVRDWVDNLGVSGPLVTSEESPELKITDKKKIYLIGTGMFVVTAANLLKSRGL